MGGGTEERGLRIEYRPGRFPAAGRDSRPCRASPALGAGLPTPPWTRPLDRSDGTNRSVHGTNGTTRQKFEVSEDQNSQG
jgi:hypothetical protein